MTIPLKPRALCAFKVPFTACPLAFVAIPLRFTYLMQFEQGFILNLYMYLQICRDLTLGLRSFYITL